MSKYDNESQNLLNLAFIVDAAIILYVILESRKVSAILGGTCKVLRHWSTSRRLFTFTNSYRDNTHVLTRWDNCIRSMSQTCAFQHISLDLTSRVASPPFNQSCLFACKLDVNAQTSGKRSKGAQSNATLSCMELHSSEVHVRSSKTWISSIKCR